MSKFFLSLVIFSLSFGPSALAESESDPLHVPVPDGWSVKYDGEKGIQFYTLTKLKGENLLLMFSHWPAPGSAEQIPGYLDSMAKALLKKVKEDKRIKLASDSYTKGKFIGDSFAGQYTVFTLENGLQQITFMFSDGDGIWNGQYTGSATGWQKCLEILKAIKKNGK